LHFSGFFTFFKPKNLGFYNPSWQPWFIHSKIISCTVAEPFSFGRLDSSFSYASWGVSTRSTRPDDVHTQLKRCLKRSRIDVTSICRRTC